MSFELRNTIWTEVEQPDELEPILTGLSDGHLIIGAIAECGLADTGFASMDIAQVREFKAGRIVIAHALRPEVFRDSAPTPDMRRWFVAGDHVVRLSHQFGTSCYSGQRPQVAATIFGPPTQDQRKRII